MKKGVLIAVIVILAILLIGLIFVALMPNLDFGGNQTTEPEETEGTEQTESEAPVEEMPVTEGQDEEPTEAPAEEPTDVTVPEWWPEEMGEPSFSGETKPTGFDPTTEEPQPTTEPVDPEKDPQTPTTPAETEEPEEPEVPTMEGGFTYPENMTEIG